MNSETLPGLISAAGEVTREAQERFGELTARQLNWQPGASRWSIGQCFDHLLTANAGYLPIFEQALDGTLKRTVWQRLPWIPRFWGKLMIHTVSPETPRKVKAPKIFHPASSDVDGAIVRRFVEQQEQAVAFMRASEDVDSEQIIIPSPVTAVITYSLIDAFRIIVAHEQRHLLQAKRVMETDGFPDGTEP